MAAVAQEREGRGLVHMSSSVLKQDIELSEFVCGYSQIIEQLGQSDKFINLPHFTVTQPLKPEKENT